MNSKNYQKHIRKLEVEEFPELAEDNYFVNMEHDGNLLFTPNHQFDPLFPLLTEEILTDLRNNRNNLLSVGCGPAYLERLLTRQLGLTTEQITLTDVSENHVPAGFEFYQFDMFADWPKFQRPFDYIIFPESMGLINSRSNDSSQRKDDLYHIIANALDCMDEVGEIRMNGHYQLSKNTSCVSHKLSQEYHGIKVSWHNLQLLTVTKGKQRN